jgi:diadenosine tetraphosphate (Ap4A) HIT family hydrolase
VSALEAVYGSPGFCIGFNVGTSSGASIEHLHCHVIPHHADRLELPKMVSSETRLKVEDPQEALKKIREAFAETEKKNSL